MSRRSRPRDSPESRALDSFPFRPPDHPIRNLLSVGRLVDKKGHRDALRTLRNVRKRGYDVSLSIVGDGPNKDDLQNFAESTGISSHVTFYGELSK